MVIDFHVHSKYSYDCFLEPAEIVRMARQKGLDGLAVTDHETMAGIEEFRKIAPDLSIIAGEEISTQEGDILGVFLKEEIKPQKDAEAVVGQIKAQGGLAILAHPFKWPHLFRRDGFLELFDAVEVFNARNNIPMPYLENLLCRRAAARRKVPMVAGSDAHEAFAVGAGRTVFDFSPTGSDDEKIRQAILERRVKVEGREVFLAVEIVSHFSRNFRKGRKKP